eukprot:1377679-Prymnesium_polylepis.1
MDDGAADGAGEGGKLPELRRPCAGARRERRSHGRMLSSRSADACAWRAPPSDPVNTRTTRARAVG